MTDNKRIGALVLTKCAAHDPWFPNGGEAMAIAWGDIFARYGLQLTDLIEGVSIAYCENGSGFKPLPADIVKTTRRVRRERLDRMTSDERRAYEDELDRRIDDKIAALEAARKDS